VTPPLILIFGPVDPTGADGLPADAVTSAHLGCHGLAAATALTVQDTAVIEDIHPVSAELLDDQARCLLEDMPVQAIKVGGLYSAETASVVAQIAADYSQVPLVLHLGQRGLLSQQVPAEDDAENMLAATLELILPQTNLAVVDFARLSQWHTDGDINIGEAPSPMHALIAGGAQWVLVLGSTLRPGHKVNILLGPDGQTATWPWQAPPERLNDTGGIVAIAATAMLARGLDMPTAVERALHHTESTYANAFLPGMGRRLLNRVGTL